MKLKIMRKEYQKGALILARKMISSLKDCLNVAVALYLRDLQLSTQVLLSPKENFQG